MKIKKELLIIKLGGAVVTDKDSLTPKARLNTISRLAKEVRQIVDQDNYNIILVHGAGSFAHGLVKKYNLQHGMKTDQQRYAFGLVTDAMLRLNSIIIGYLFRAKLQAVSVIPHTFIIQSKGKLNYIEAGMIQRYLKNNQIPVLFGDMVLDDKWGCSVLSGDTIVTYLASKLKADKVIFLTDVDGIYDCDPKKNPKAKLISEVNNSNIKQVLKGLSPSKRADVTGEMYGKILMIKQSAKQVPMVIVNGLKKGNLAKISDQSPVGTRLYLQ